MEVHNNNEDDRTSSSSSTPERQLMEAVRARDVNAVLRALLVRGVLNVNLPDERFYDQQRAPLHVAAWNGDLQILQTLLVSRHGVNVEVRDRKGFTPLQLAVWKGHKQAVKALIDQGGADLETRDDEQRTPLMLACGQQDQEMALLLIEKGACVSSIDASGGNVLHHACYSDGNRDPSWTLLEILISKGADVNAKTHRSHETPLYFAAYLGRVQSMQVLLANGSDLHARSIRGGTALHAAVSGDRHEAVRFLLDAGAAVENKDQRGLTPLHLARSVAVAEELIRRGANIFARADNNVTPFDTAFAQNRSAVYRCFLQHYRENFLATHGSLSLHALLQEAKYIEVRERRNNNEIVMKKMVSLRLGRVTIELMLESLLSFLLSQDPDMILTQDAHRSIPLHILCQSAGDAPIELLRWLVAQDSSTLHYSDRSGCLPLHLACHARAPAATLCFLVEQGGVGTLCARDQDGALPLHSMVSHVSTTNIATADATRAPPSPPPKIDAVEYVVKMYPNAVATRNDRGDLPIMLACQSSAPEEILFVLLKAHPESIDYMTEYFNSASVES